MTDQGPKFQKARYSWSWKSDQWPVKEIERVKNILSSEYKTREQQNNYIEKYILNDEGKCHNIKNDFVRFLVSYLKYHLFDHPEKYHREKGKPIEYKKIRPLLEHYVKLQSISAGNIKELMEQIDKHIDESGGVLQYYITCRDEILSDLFPTGYTDGVWMLEALTKIYLGKHDINIELESNELITHKFQSGREQIEFTEERIENLEKLKKQGVIAFTSTDSLCNGEKIDILISKYDAISLMEIWGLGRINKKNKIIYDNFTYQGMPLKQSDVRNARHLHKEFHTQNLKQILDE